MPLKDQPTDRQYIDRRRIQISGHSARSNNDGSKRWDIFNYSEDVDGHPSNVSAIELTGFIVPQMYVPIFPFPEQLPSQPGSRYLDILMVDPTGTYADFTFSVEMPFLRRATPEITYQLLVDMIEEAMNDATPSHPVFRLPTTQWSVEYDVEFADGTYGGVSFSARTAIATPFSPEITFRFGSGPNADNSAWYELGFEQGVDAGPNTPPSGNAVIFPTPTRLYNFWPYRYINIDIDEIPEFTPHSRVYLCKSNEYAGNSHEAIDGVRLLTQPPRRLDTMTVHISLRNGATPHPLANDPHSFTFDLLLSVPEFGIPDWIRQSLDF